MSNQYTSIIKNPNHLNIDEVVYLVTKIANFGSVQKVIITSKPYISEHTESLFIKCLMESLFSNSVYSSEFSLLDYNVIPNTYNKHRVFSDYIEALKYSKE